LDSNPDKLGIFNKKIFPLETRGDGGAETQSIVSDTNISGLNPISLRRAGDVKAYVLSIAIPPSDEDVKHGGALGTI
jgi:hypothetical protein